MATGAFWCWNRVLALEDYGGVMTRLTLSIAIIFFVSGCAHVIPKDILQKVNPEVTFAELKKDPQAYREKVVLLGGVIVKTVNKNDGTLLEVYQTEIDRRGKPIKLDISGGRFLALWKGFLDSEIYQKGRKVTIVGVMKGEEMIRLGEVDYRCPYLVVEDIHLWEKEQPQKYMPYPYYPWYPLWYPWYPYHPGYWR
jgi:outer membrane lipoprotein